MIRETFNLYDLAHIAVLLEDGVDAARSKFILPKTVKNSNAGILRRDDVDDSKTKKEPSPKASKVKKSK